MCVAPLLVASPAAARAQVPRQVVIVAIARASLQDLLAVPEFAALVRQGGAALLIMTDPGDALRDYRGAVTGVHTAATRLHVIHSGTPAAGAGRLAAWAKTLTAREVLVMVVSDAPSMADAAVGDRLGALVMAEGTRSDLVAAMSASVATVTPLRTLTSDSTRRDGVVTSRDLAQTVIAFAGVQGAHDPGGSAIRTVDAPPPFELQERYLQQKRLSVPIGTAAALYVTFGGLLGAGALAWRRSPRWLRDLGATVVASAPMLALALLLVGHLPSLTIATVAPFLIAMTALSAIAVVRVARRRGSLMAIAVAGAVLLAAFVVEAAVGWSAALTPLLGGSQLDGGRFFGLPNAFIGLLLGASVYVAQRLPRAAGTALLATAGLFAGSPWTGSNIGAAVTLFASAGIWWGLGGELGWVRTTTVSAAVVAVGTGLVIVAHRYLTSAPTHITRFTEHTGGIPGLWHKLVSRLGVGVHLIAANPFAVLPVVGMLATLAVVLRPPRQVRVTFAEAPIWRIALLTILLGSIVAYLVNDSGAAAIGEGFTTSLAGLLFVSLLRRNDIMEEA
jgi:hypothetical protein